MSSTTLVTIDTLAALSCLPSSTVGVHDWILGPARRGDVYDLDDEQLADFVAARRSQVLGASAAPFALPLLSLTQVFERFTPDEFRLSRAVKGLREGAAVPPIHAYRDRHGAWRVVDGRHRVTAARSLRLETIASVDVVTDALHAARGVSGQ